jgi:multiple sugar transport system permease protein
VSGRGRALRSALLLAVAAVFLVPQLWLFSVSLKSKSGVFEYPPRLVGETASADNYRFVMTRTQVPTYLWNSGRVALFATVLTLLLGLPAAYVLSRERFRSRGPLLSAFLVVQTVSPIILLVPIYGVVARFGLLDTHTGLVLVYAAVQLPLTVVIMKTFFDAIPPSLFEAARLDGATRAHTFRRVALPLVGPGLAATAIFNLAAYWAEFGLALVLLDSQSRFTVPLGLFSFESGYETEWQLVAAASFIGLLPVIAAFVLLQRYFVAGLTAGAVKG